MARTYHYSTAFVGFAYYFRRCQCFCTIYVYHILSKRKMDTEEDKSKSTILIISMGFLFLYLLFHWQWALFVSLIIGIVGIISPFLSKKIEWVWMKLAQFMGQIIPNILLCVVFFLFLLPISRISKLFNKDPLMLSKNYKTYFIDVNRTIDKESFKKIW